MQSAHTVVLKFGSSVLRSEEDLPRVVHEMYQHVRRHERVVAVVSALGSTTDDLLRRATQWSGPDRADADALALLLGTGETVSAALLNLALRRAGIPASVLDPWRADLRTTGPRLDATPLRINVHAVRRALQLAPVTIVPGFFGLDDATGAPTLLGRGGSDLTATFIASQLGCREVVLLKDVDGIYTRDPGHHVAPDNPRPCRYRSLTFDDAIQLESGVVQTAALCCARDHQLPVRVKAIGTDEGTCVDQRPTELATAESSRDDDVVRVAVLGCGTVGSGVVSHLAKNDRFEIVSVLVRDPAKSRDLAVTPSCLKTSVKHVFASRPDVIVETIGGVGLARDIIERALQRGIHVVTANKTVIAEVGSDLQRTARQHGATLRYSAAVGGGVPMIEHVASRRDPDGIVAFEGVCNGTSAVVLDALAAGLSLDEAVTSAQQQGYAEADCSRDLEGRDAADKAAILARHAFGVDLDPALIPVSPINDGTALLARLAHDAGRRLRQVVSCERGPDGRVCASVVLRELPLSDPRVGDGPWCGLRVTASGDGDTYVAGLGAGRWPTAEAVFADLLDVARDGCATKVSSPVAVGEVVS